MNESEKELAAYLTEIKKRKIGFMELHVSESEPRVAFFLDARYDWFSTQCIFDDCDEAQAKLLLQSFLTHNLSVSWSVSEQLSKLLSVQGHLVGETVDQMLKASNYWRGTQQLFLSYLALRPDGPELASRFLDEIEEDFRDGLLLACHRLNSEALDRKLMAKFLEWESGDWSPGSTGELYALEQFIAKWVNIYPIHELEVLVRIYFKYQRAR